VLSLSHIAVVAVVVAIIVIAWKFERRKPNAQSPAARSHSIPRQILKVAVLVILFAGALSPQFGDEETVRYIHIVCTTGLAGLAYLWMFMSAGR
jgi:protein-S-isoprenylcysteine O-methyltransferase Ste14